MNTNTQNAPAGASEIPSDTDAAEVPGPDFITRDDIDAALGILADIAEALGTLATIASAAAGAAMHAKQGGKPGRG